MAHGKSLEMAAFSRMFNYRKVEDPSPTGRDRSLPGKKRVKARKAKNKET